MREELTIEVFRNLKEGDIISNKQYFPNNTEAGWDYEVVEGYKNGHIRIRIMFSIRNKIHKGRAYNFYESNLPECIGLYKKI